MSDTVSVEYKEEPTGSEAPPTPTPTPQAREDGQPGWLPANFKSVEDFVKSSTDSRAELTRVQQELAKLKKPAEGEAAATTPEGKTEGTPETPKLKIEEGKAPEEGQQQALEDIAKKAGVDTATWQQEFNETGDISEGNRAKMVEVYGSTIKSIFGKDADPAAVVADYVEGQRARATNYVNEAVKPVGGMENFQKMAEWAKTNMPRAEVEAINATFAKNDIAAAHVALAGLQAKFVAANGSNPSLISNTAPSTDSGKFASSTELVKAVGDPRYKTDPAYRKSVEQKMMRS